MRARNALQALLAAGALSLALAPGAQAAQPVHVSCGETITEDTKLANDLIDCPEHGIVIGADGITLDLNGHTIDGVAACPDIEAFCGAGILNHVDGEPGHSGVTIENGSIQEFSIGALVVRGNNNRLRNLATSSNTSVGLVVAESEHGEIERNSSASECIGIQVAGAREVRVERNSVSDHTCAGIALYGSDHVRVADNAVSQTREGNDTSGVFVIDHSDHNRIERNSVSGNGFVGVIVEQSHDNEVAGNDIFRNSTGIILFASRNAITGNQVADSVSCPDGCGVGISLEGGEGNLIARNEVRRTPHEGILIAAFDPDTPTVDNVVRDNRIRDATVDGFGVATQGEGTVSGTLIQGNLAVGSGDDGFDIESSATTLTKNTANENHDLGIEAVPGVTDGGGNKASGNGNPLQCTNVFCK